MIKRIKRKLKEFENRFRKIDSANHQNKLSQDKIESNQQIHFDYNHLSQLFNSSEFIPFTTYSISPSTILHVLNDILLNQKENIIEFGAGASTLYIAKFLKNLNLDVKFLCIESDERWLQKVKTLAIKYDVVDCIVLVNAPLVKVNKEIAYKSQTLWYDTEVILNKFEEKQFFDLVLIDGPLRKSSPYVRYSAGPFLKPFLSEKVSIYLDDTFRAEELEIINEWKDLLNLQLEHFNKYSTLTDKRTYTVQPFKLNKWKNP